MIKYPTAVRLLRKLRGGSQAHLVQADDDYFYAIKSPDNPQSKRVLVNEYLGARVFEHMGIAAAKITPLHVPQSFLDGNPDFGLQFHRERVSLRSGVFLASRYGVSPEKVAIYDMLPEPLLPKIANSSHFWGALVADQWLSNQDARQCVFFRDQTSDVNSRRGFRAGFRAVAIDHGFCLGGPSWQLRDSPLTGIYFQVAVYRTFSGAREIEPWFERLNTITQQHFTVWVEEMPSEWLRGDEWSLQILIERLIRRKGRVLELVEAAIEAHPKWFPDTVRPARC